MKGPFAALSLALTLFSASQISSVEAINLRLRFPGLHLLNSPEAQSTDNPTHLNLRRRAGGLFDSRNDIIVVLKDDEDSRVRKLSQGNNMPEIAKKNKAKAAAIAKGLGVQPKFTYGAAVYGFSVKGVTQAQVQAIEASDAVAYVEMDQTIQLDPMEMQGDVRRRLAPPPGKGPNRGDGGEDGGSPPQVVPWGIRRVIGTNPLTAYTGDKVAWVIDTGIDLDHPDLNVDASRGFNAFTSGKDGRSPDDGNGHGTHVAGTIAAIHNSIGVVGVAPGAIVIPVKVLDSRGSGSYSGVIAGVDYVAASCSCGDVANMSLGGPPYRPLDDAIVNAASNGCSNGCTPESNRILFALAAGNSGDNANNYSPARANHDNIYTISAIDINDNFASFSNYGNSIDYADPGVSIMSTVPGGYATYSGTSMAAPHTAGILLATNGNCGIDGTVNNDPDGSPDDIACL